MSLYNRQFANIIIIKKKHGITPNMGLQPFSAKSKLNYTYYSYLKKIIYFK